MKYFISNKETRQLNFTKISEDDFLKKTEAITDELIIYPGTFESSDSCEAILNKMKLICSKDCKITLAFINIYQLFVNVANHNIDVGIGHLTCKSIKNPFNVNAAIGFVKSFGLKINKVYLEDGCSIIKIDCHV